MAISISFITKWFTIQKKYSEMYSNSYSNICLDIRTFKVDGMAWNIKKWVCQEWETSSPWNKNLHKGLLQSLTTFSKVFIFRGGNI